MKAVCESLSSETGKSAGKQAGDEKGREINKYSQSFHNQRSHGNLSQIVKDCADDRGNPHLIFPENMCHGERDKQTEGAAAQTVQHSQHISGEETAEEYADKKDQDRFAGG